MLRTFKIIALLEGTSLLLLLLFAMPMKYYFDQPVYVRVIGMAHGVLFIGYVALAVILALQFKWLLSKFLAVAAASIIPFGTFYIERKYFRNV